LFNSKSEFDDTPVQFAFVNSPEPLVSVAHELFHLFGRPHASACNGANIGVGGGTVPAETWPLDQQGYLQSVGLAPAEPGNPFPYQVIPATSAAGTQWYDFMSYCDNVSDGDPLTGTHNAWVSVHNWNAVLSEFGYSAARDKRAAHASSAADVHTIASLRVRASVAPGGHVTIDDVEPVNAPPQKPSTSPYDLIATGTNGATMAEIPMQASFGHVDARPPVPLLTLTGVVPATAVTGIRISDSGATLATRTENRYAPVVTVPRLPSFGKTNATLHWQASERGGGALSVEVDYSGRRRTQMEPDLDRAEPRQRPRPAPLPVPLRQRSPPRQRQRRLPSRFRQLKAVPLPGGAAIGANRDAVVGHARAQRRPAGAQRTGVR
jgi:hypothetical protein